MAQDDHAIVVGITTYPGFRDLAGPERDAVAFREWLIDPTKGAVPPANVKTLLTSSMHPPPPATAAEARPGPDDVHQLLRPHVQQAGLGKRVGRRLYIYAAGHGFSDPADMRSAALYAANAEFMFPLHVAMTAYADFFQRSAAFDDVVLIMDCCRTVSALESVLSATIPNIGPNANAKNVRTFTAFGASWGGPAREKAFGPNTRGIFTMTLLEALDRCEPDEHGNVTGQKLKEYIHNRIDAVAAPEKVDPPDIPIGSRDVALLTRPAAPPAAVTFTLEPAAVGKALVITRSQVEVHREILAARSTIVPLRPAIYKARVDGLNTAQLFEVTGGEVSVAL